MNERGKVLDVHGGVDAENRNVQVWNRHNGLNQQWEILYADSAKPAPTKGYFPLAGLYINRPFYVVSHLPSKRYLDLVGRNLVIKTKNGRSSQVFYFDAKTRTIKSQQNKGWSFSGRSAGRSNDMEVWNTNSAWY